MEFCYPNGITFASQAEVDLFPAVNPGCKIIGGSMTINGADITNLDSLISIEKINGKFLVFSNNLVNFQGLNNLDTIGDNFSITGAGSIVNFVGLESLKKIGKPSSFNVFKTSGFNDFIGLDSLTSIEGRLLLDNCNSLTSLQGLENISFLEDFEIRYCQGLSSLQGLEGLTSVDVLELKNLYNLTSIDGLSNLQSAGLIKLSDIVALSDISAFLNLNSVNSFSIYNSDVLINLNGLEGLNIINTSLTLNQNDLLNDISALENVDIKDIDALNIYNNPELGVCNYLSICQYLSDDGDSYLFNNDVGCNGVLEIEYDCIGLLSIFEITETTSFAGSSSDNYWHNAANWRNNIVPVDSSYVIIPSGDISIIQQDSIANCQILNVMEGASIKIESGGVLNILDID